MDNDTGAWLLAISPLVAVGVLLLVVGIVLILITIKRKVTGKLKKFQLLAGASALGIPVFAVLKQPILSLNMVNTLSTTLTSKSNGIRFFCFLSHL